MLCLKRPVLAHGVSNNERIRLAAVSAIRLLRSMDCVSTVHVHHREAKLTHVVLILVPCSVTVEPADEWFARNVPPIECQYWTTRSLFESVIRVSKVPAAKTVNPSVACQPTLLRRPPRWICLETGCCIKPSPSVRAAPTWRREVSTAEVRPSFPSRPRSAWIIFL